MSDFLTFVQGAFVDKVLSTANQWQQIGQVNGSGNFANISLNFTNISPTENDTISVAISNNSTSPNNDDIIESNIPMPVGAVLSRENIIAEVGEYVYILATTANIACRFSGITQALQDLESFDAELSNLSSEIEYLSGVIDTNNTNLQDEINALTSELNSDIASLSASTGGSVNNLQDEINALTATLNSNVNALSAAIDADNTNLQNEINALTGTLDSDVSNLQSQINSLNGSVSNAINQLNSVNGDLFANINNQTGSIGLGGTYANDTGSPMFITAIVYPNQNPNNTRGAYGVQALVDGEVVANTNYYGYGGSNIPVSCSFMVPNGSTYVVNSNCSFGVSSYTVMTFTYK